MNLRPYKFIVTAVLQQTNGDDQVTGEVAVEPVTVYGHEQLAVWATRFPEALSNQVSEHSV